MSESLLTNVVRRFQVVKSIVKTMVFVEPQNSKGRPRPGMMFGLPKGFAAHS